MTPDIARLAYKSHQDIATKFNSLTGLIFRKDGLMDSFNRLPGNKAAGADGLSKDDYAEGVTQRLEDLSSQLRDLSYRPQPARRVYIPKADGGRRPLGIPAFEDRIVQDRISQVLQTIWEPEFQPFSYGFRPGKNAHQALHKLAETITMKPIRYVCEADIKGFFNHVNHDWLMKFLGHRISDERFLRLIHRMLKAGVMEDGAVYASEEGTPQGGLASPVLANIYLHYVLDLWFERVFKGTCEGEAYLIRYADDFVACFEKERDATRFMQAMPERLGKFCLETEPSKTKKMRFGKWSEQDNQREGKGKTESFNFLGFTHFAGKSRKGNFIVGRKTERKRIKKKLREASDKLKRLRTAGGRAMYNYARQHLQGHIQYYGVSGNYRSLDKYKNALERILFRWLNRRSQRPSIDWKRFSKILDEGLLPKIRIVHNLYDFYPKPSLR